MRQDVEDVLKLDNFIYKLPKNIFDPKIIFDIGVNTKYSTLGFATIYPEAKIYSITGNQNFLLNKNALAYHDNVFMFSFADYEIDLDNVLFGHINYGTIVDMVYLNVSDLSIDFLRNGYSWPDMVRTLKIRATEENYDELKNVLKEFNYESWAMYDGVYIHVVGESNHVQNIRESG